MLLSGVRGCCRGETVAGVVSVGGVVGRLVPLLANLGALLCRRTVVGLRGLEVDRLIGVVDLVCGDSSFVVVFRFLGTCCLLSVWV